MCTLIAIHRGVAADAPLIVAANRDEYYERPAEGPAIREVDGRRVLAPRDLRAGGTWLGVNDESVFAAVTNLRNNSPDPHRRSRGWIVMDALREPTAAGAADMLKALPEEAYNPFQCFVADGARAFHLVYRDAPRVHELRPGVHVVGNVDPREEPAPKVERIRERVAGIGNLKTERALEELARVCAEHGTGGGGGGDTCVHLGSKEGSKEGGSKEGGYGTRSSILLALRGTGLEAKGSKGRLLVAEGAPCETGYEDQSTLLGQLWPGETVMGNHT